MLGLCRFWMTFFLNLSMLQNFLMSQTFLILFCQIKVEIRESQHFSMLKVLDGQAYLL